MLIKAYAKINWTLDVLYRRDDGYHELDTLMQQVSLYDDVELSPADSIAVTADPAAGSSIPVGNENIAYKAAKTYLDAANIRGGVAVHIVKRIPVEAGLGGGSADAAAVLRGLNDMHGAFSGEELSRIALSVGADVPFCLAGGAARCRGVGERIQSVAPRALPLVLVKPEQGISTRALFTSLDLTGRLPHSTDKAVDAYLHGDLRDFGSRLRNALSEPAFELLGDIRRAVEALGVLGAIGAGMSGSGSCCFGLFESLHAAHEACDRLRGWPFVKVCTTIGEE